MLIYSKVSKQQKGKKTKTAPGLKFKIHKDDLEETSHGTLPRGAP